MKFCPHLNGVALLKGEPGWENPDFPFKVFTNGPAKPLVDGHIGGRSLGVGYAGREQDKHEKRFRKSACLGAQNAHSAGILSVGIGQWSALDIQQFRIAGTTQWNGSIEQLGRRVAGATLICFSGGSAGRR
jgi:hypothetical protein